MLPDPSDGWILTAHACRHCLARIVSREGVFRCSTCGARTEGEPSGICGCGLTNRAAGGLPSRRLFRCVPNPQPGPSNPAQIVISFAAPPGAAG